MPAVEAPHPDLHLRYWQTARDAVANAGGRRAALEASGGITLGTVAEVAATGVEFLSVGALTHSAPALDLSMLVEPTEGADEEAGVG